MKNQYIPDSYIYWKNEEDDAYYQQAHIILDQYKFTDAIDETDKLLVNGIVGTYELLKLQSEISRIFQTRRLLHNVVQSRLC